MQDKVKDLGGETKDFIIYGPLFVNNEYTFDKDNFEIRENVKSGIPFLGNVYVIKEGEFTKEFPLLITSESALCFVKLDNYSVVLNFDLGITYYRVNKQNEVGTPPADVKVSIVMYGLVS